MAAELIVVPESVRELAEKSVGAFFEPLAKQASARDHVKPGQALKNAEILEKFVSLRGKKLLEIGAGFGLNLATWIKAYQVDGYGTQRDAEGFASSFVASREVFTANGVDPSRIIRVADDTLPFEDGSFDVVYSKSLGAYQRPCEGLP